MGFVRSTINILVLLTLIALAACSMEQMQSSEFQETNIVSSYEKVVGGNVSEVGLNNSETDLDLSGLDPNEDIVLALYSFDTSANSNSIEINGIEAAPSLNSPLASSQKFNEDDVYSDDDTTEGFHNQLRDLESKIEDDVYQSNQNFTSLMAQLERIEAKVGDETKFKVLSTFNSGNDNSETVVATLRYQTDYFNVYVDNRDAKSLTDVDLASIAQDFLDVIPIEQDYFGKESDINGDGRFDILFSQAVNKLGVYYHGIITGFFYAADLLSPNVNPISNQREIIYILVPDPSGEHNVAISKPFAINNMIKGTLPHEYQHMISYNQHVLIEGGVSEVSWLNESMSHFAEDLVAIDLDAKIKGYGLENPSHVGAFLSDVDKTCLTCGTNIAQRGAGYLFVKYLYEQAELGNLPGVDSGIDLINLLSFTHKIGIENIVSAVYGDDEPISRFKDLMGLFSVAVYLSNSGVTSDDRYSFYGMKLRGLLEDNRGTYLLGPAIKKIYNFPFSEVLQGSSVSYVQIPASLIQANGGVLTFTTNPGSNIGAYLIQK